MKRYAFDAAGCAADVKYAAPLYLHNGLNKAADTAATLLIRPCGYGGHAMTDHEILMIMLTVLLLIVEILKMRK